MAEDNSMDWEDLAGSRFPTVGGSNGYDATSTTTTSTTMPHRTQRNLSELQAAGQTLFSGSGGGNYYMMPPPSQQQPGVSAATTGSATTTTANGGPPTHGGGRRVLEPLEDVVARHEQQIFDDIIRRTREVTRQRTNEAVEAQLQSAWEKERAAWYREITGKPVVPNSRSTTAASAAAAPMLTTRSSMMHPMLPSRQQQQQQEQNFATTARQNNDNLVDRQLVEAHWSIVQGMKKHNADNLGANIAIVADFSRLANRIVEGSAGSNAVHRGYASAWQLVERLVRRASTSSSATLSPVEQARATLSHFCLIYRDHIVAQSAAAERSGHQRLVSANMTYKNDWASQCDGFAKMTVVAMQERTATTTDHSNPSAWPTLYFCLRCGDAVAAYSVVQQVQSFDNSVKNIVRALAQAQGGLTCIWESNKNVTVNEADREAVKNMLEGAKRAGSHPDTYEMGVYSLLASWPSLQPVTSDTEEGFKNIEDYLTALLWKAVLQPNPVDGLIALGELVRKFGPSYFDDPASGGWSYALPLLATQQYREALNWLAREGGSLGLLQATHIGLVLSTSGITIRDLGPGGDAAAAATTPLTSPSSSSSDNGAALFVSYAKQVLLAMEGPMAALDYLVQISNKVRAQKEVAYMIANMDANTSTFNEFAGQSNEEGRRVGGALQKHFSAEEVSSVLAMAAKILSGNKYENKNDRGKMNGAVTCMKLSERYAEMVVMMNNLISPPDKQDEERTIWLRQCELFHRNFIVKRTQVLETLERQEETLVLETNRMLMSLNNFFQKVREGGSPSNECLAIVDHLQLLPTSDADLPSKERDYKGLDPLIQAVYPSLLLECTNLVQKEHMRCKREEMSRGSSDLVRKRLRELQDKANRYARFAVDIGIDNTGHMAAMI